MSERQDGPSRARIEMFVAPTDVRDGYLHGWIWSTAKGRVVPVRAELPAHISAEVAMRGARECRLVLPSGSGHMSWSRA
jgi:hypothetical protein